MKYEKSNSCACVFGIHGVLDKVILVAIFLFYCPLTPSLSHDVFIALRTSLANFFMAQEDAVTDNNHFPPPSCHSSPWV